MSDSEVQYDAVIVGGGTGGVPAAIAAARNGSNVLLIEKNGFLGGLASGGLMSAWPHWLARHSWEDPKEPYVEGIYAETLERLDKLGALALDRHNWDDEMLKYVLEEMCLESGVKLLLHSFAFRVSKDGRYVTSVEIANKSGAMSVSGKVFIDGTGDGDLISLAGARWQGGREADGATQPMSLTFRLGGVDCAKVPKYSPTHYILSLYWAEPRDMPDDVAAIHKEYLAAQKRGEITNPRGELLWWHHFRPGVIHFNTTRIQHLDATKAEDRTKAEIEGKRQVVETLRFLKRFSGFENAYLIKMSNEVGVRETRRIVGEYTLTEEDVLGGRKFEDGVARGHGPVDIHDPTQSTSTMIYCPDYTSYDIPYRCLLPKDLDNVLVASRCISATHEAFGSVRMVPQIFAIGEAAGTAAALTCKQGVPCKRLDVGLLRSTLREQGASVWEEGMPG